LDTTLLFFLLLLRGLIGRRVAAAATLAECPGTDSSGHWFPQQMSTTGFHLQSVPRGENNENQIVHTPFISIELHVRYNTMFM
jgi:hypothetical protein